MRDGFRASLLKEAQGNFKRHKDVADALERHRQELEQSHALAIKAVRRIASARAQGELEGLEEDLQHNMLVDLMRMINQLIKELVKEQK